ncbi:MAG: LuxR C-terminal-related transcriptional regulator [Vicinamibacterales bacterium]
MATKKSSERLDANQSIAAGYDALSRSAWEEATALFERTLGEREDPRALEGLGLAAWWLDRTSVVFDARERAYRLYREEGNARAAARVAVWLAWDYQAFRGEPAVARGWLGLARQLLKDDTCSPEYAWLSVREAVLVLFMDGDPDGATALARQASAAARAAGSRDYELLGVAVEGLARVTAGAVADGMRMLDDVSAAIISGEIREPLAIGLAGCYLLSACDRVRDYDRAAQWCGRIKGFCVRWGLRQLFAVCRTQYAAVCLWNGEWNEAERELVAAVDEFNASRPAMSVEGAARLGELRRRQGRLDDAKELFDRAKTHPLAVVGRAALALDRGDAASAGDLAERYLRAVPVQNRTERVAALELLIRAKLSLGLAADARTAVEELESIAADAATVPLMSVARLGRGLIEAADGNLDAARRAYEDAVDGFERTAALYEAARARLELASVLNACGRVDVATRETQHALEGFTRLAASLDQARAEQQLSAMHGTTPVTPSQTPLSRREREVLGLIAKGLSNQRIAGQLFISEHTVHRHIANVLAKLDVSSRSAAVARAIKQGVLEG